ncbi:MAG TPA: universal stress protein [Candidatus Bathyarchaeia archaeon]|nr:universal stress protein [Candidatus Bathyarchaeia archaeon]
MTMRSILAAVDQSRHAEAVVSRAAELASLLNCDLTIMTAVGSDPTRIVTIPEEREQVAKLHRELIYKHFPKEISVESKKTDGIVYRRGRQGSRIVSRILVGNPVDMICSCADDLNSDLVVVGSRGLGNAGTLVLGSVSEKVVRKCSHSILVVKGDQLANSDWEAITSGQTHQQRAGVWS